MINKCYKDTKTIIKKNNITSELFIYKYSISPYLACEHGCKYCDGRSEKYHITGDFDKDITIKSNIVANLENEMKKLREPGPVLIGSGVTDPYQPIELDEKIVRRCGEILTRFNYPVVIITKSKNILRDIDIWEKIKDKSGFTLLISLSSLDEKQRKIFEPNASTIEERLNVIKVFKQRGFNVGVLAMPLLPGISDSYESIFNLGIKLKELNIDFIVPGGLTLKKGRQKELYLSVVKKHYYDEFAKTKKLFLKENINGSPLHSYESKLYSSAYKVFNELQIPTQTPHYIYKKKVPIYDEIYILLCHMIELFRCKGVDTKPLNRSFFLYRQWLNSEKKVLNRSKKYHYSSLEAKLRFMLQTDMFSDLIKNKKLSQFVRNVIIENKVFNYLELTFN